jgi:serine phosphatase RsbU (regulator of sigma subunit)
MYPISLRQVPLFSTLPEEDLSELTKLLRPRDVTPGSILCQEGQRGDRLYIILEGQVDIIKEMGHENERALSLKGPGDFIGEMSMFERDGLRTASARARSKVQVAEMTHTALEAILRRNPSLAYEVVRELSLRLHETDNAVICDLQEKNLQLETALQNLKNAQDQIVAKEKLEHELMVAQRIQLSILPSELPVVAGFEFGARVLPARAVGGDFFDIIPLSEHQTAVAIGDVSDKGVPAAIFMAMCRSLLRAESHPHTPPAEVLRRVNHHLLGMNEVGLFVTVLYGVLDSQVGKMNYARAGHEIPMVVTPQGKLTLAPQGRGQPLGILPAPALDQQSLQLTPGSTLYLTTDGLADAENEQGRRLGHASLYNAAIASVRPSAQAACNALLEAVAQHQGRAAPNDDITLMTILVR